MNKEEKNERKQCPACARDVKDFWRFCPQCGNQLKKFTSTT